MSATHLSRIQRLCRLHQVLSLCDNWLRNPEEVTAEIRGLYQTEL